MITKTQIEAARAIYDLLSGWKKRKEAIISLFSQNTRNNSTKVVLPKIATLDKYYSTSIYNPDELAEYIISIKNLDELLKDGNPEAVEQIRQFKLNGKLKNILSFASKYCHFHKTDSYPIYDQYASLALQKLSDWRDFPENQSPKRTFAHFNAGVINLKNQNGLTNVSFEDFDSFLWLYGQPESLNSEKSKINKEVSALYKRDSELFYKLK